ncbi:WD40 repeat-like protein [Anaeromyces robustus]|jgi:WD40 repeat protein|uniref:WD40 repeat-like protein n=1 Tax=Anaeromyces robustus TaxID=1754192 RepID=A0A1Y1XPZ2_9FUNG|nr:WD40 repeat-like protein [Anaeromyces robustus]|eukprot:ORX87820.1 WD40 repeat-like protein [Anaeromyces robustus]
MSYLEVCLIQAKGLQPQGAETKNEKDRSVDPYALIFYGNASENSKIIYDTNNPVWRESFYFECKNPKETKIEVVIHDKEICATDLPIGHAEFKFENVKLNEYSKQWTSLKDGEGEIEVAVTLRSYDYPGVAKSKVGKKDKHFQENDDQVNRAWAGAIVKPDNAPSATNKLPLQTLVLDHVYGYRTRDTRDNLFAINSDTIVYHAAAVGIVHNIKTGKQRFFNGSHVDDILCLTCHPNKKYIATGDIVSLNGEGPNVAIWDSTSPESAPLVTFKIGEGKLMRNVSTMGFSCDGKYLIIVTGDNYHSVRIYDWKAKTLLCTEKGHSDKILDIDNHPKDPNSFVTVGVKHIKFWKFDSTSKRFTTKKGLFGKAKIQTILCPLYIGNGDILLTGTYSGEIYIWNTNTGEVVGTLNTGHASIYGVTYEPEFGLACGHRDGYITLFDVNESNGKMKKITEVNVNLSVKSLDYSPEGNLIVGTSESVIFMVKSFKKNDPKTNIELLYENHSSAKMEELWGIDGNPTNENEFVSCSDDGALIIWDTENYKQKKRINIQNEKLRAVSYSADGNKLFVGCVSGNIIILNTKDLSIIKTIPYEKRSFIKSNEHGITVIKCSPDGTKFAAGSRDCVINIYGTNNYNRIGTMTGHSSTIVHMDWSNDSKYIQSDSADCEILYWNINDMTQVTKLDELKSVCWYTWSLILGWPVQSIWENGWSNSTINAVARDKRNKLLATADDNSQVRLFSYPVVLDKQPCRRYTGHSSHVTNVIFLGNKYVISTGGMDGSIFQWKIKE